MGFPNYYIGCTGPAALRKEPWTIAGDVEAFLHRKEGAGSGIFLKPFAAWLLYSCPRTLYREDTIHTSATLSTQEWPMIIRTALRLTAYGSAVEAGL